MSILKNLVNPVLVLCFFAAAQSNAQAQPPVLSVLDFGSTAIAKQASGNNPRSTSFNWSSNYRRC
jgi:hypothetical protein